MTLLLAVSVLRVHLRGSDPAAVIEHAWQKQPPVSCDALFGTSRFALSIGEHSLWFAYKLNPQVIQHAHDDGALRHAVEVALSEELRYGHVSLSSDLAEALRHGLDFNGLAARVRASSMQCGGRCAQRVAQEPRIVRVLSDEILRQALVSIGVF